MPLSVPALIVTRSPAVKTRRTNESCPPVIRSGIGGVSKVIDGAQASASTSAGRFVGPGAGPRCAKTGTAARPAANRPESRRVIGPPDCRPEPGAAIPGLLRDLQRLQALD